MKLRLLAPLLFACALGWADPSAPPLPAAEILNRYFGAAHAQQIALRGRAMQVEIDAAVPKLHKMGKLRAVRNISVVGRVTYRMLRFSGDNTVKKEVIARYLAAEIQAQGNSELSIGPENYKFKYKGMQPGGGRGVYVFRLSPRSKRAGLFKGELWLDAQTYMPLRECGKFVKTPSIFLKSMEFVRTYELEDGVSVPQRLESHVATRVFGPVTLNIDFSSAAPEAETETDSAADAASR